ncbi:MAG: glycosyltransferase family 2 protein [Elusimicrobiota bacterium]
MITIAVCAHDLISGGRRRYLRAALESVSRQTLPPRELLLFDDGSTDGTADWVAAQRFPNLRVIRSKRNLGSARLRNRAIREARGELVGFLDSDDLFYPRYLEKMSAAFADARVMAAVADLDDIDSKGAVLAGKAVPRRADAPPPWYAKATGLRYLPGFSSLLFRRRVFSEIGFLDEGLRRAGDDADILYRIGLRFGKAALRFVDGPLMAYRKHDGPHLTEFVWSLLGRRSGGLRSTAASCAGLGPAARETALDLCQFAHKHGLHPDRR